MISDSEAAGDGLGAQTAGQRLRAAREGAGQELAQIAAETRIPLRHLEAIEDGAFARLPSRTYAVGFSRTYARHLGLDEHAIVDQVRAELADGGAPSASPAAMEPGDPAHVPSRSLAWFAVLAAIILGAGVFAFYRTYFSPGLGPAPLSEAAPATPRPAATAAAPAPVASGPVVFTSLMDDTWVKFYDGSGARLFEGVMAKGDSFTVPADAANPQVRTGRPYAFAITVGGRSVAKLSEKDEVIKDVPVSAAALLARPAPAPASVSGASAVPATGAAAAPAPANAAPAAAPLAPANGAGRASLSR